MSRILTNAHLAAIKSGHVRPFTLVELDYPDGPVRASSLPFNVVVDGQTYFGVDRLGAVTEISEGVEQRSYGVNITLSGIPQTFTNYIAEQDIQGRLIKISIGFLDKNHAMLGAPISVFVGRMDTQDIKLGKETSISIAGETLLIDWERPRLRKFTDADQKTDYPGDRGLEHVAEMANKELVWGRT